MRLHYTKKYRFVQGLLLLLIAVVFSVGSEAQAVAGVPKILNHQGRLLDAAGNLLGGTGTDFCFKFSIYDDATVGAPDTKLWPTAAPSTMTINVKNGIFNVGVGDTVAGGDTLDFNFQDNDAVFLNVEVATKVGATCAPGDGAEVFENLGPRQRILSSGYTINSDMVDGFHAAQSATGSQIPVLSTGNLGLGTTNPQINATGTNTLTLQGGAGTGDIQFFGSSNKITSVGALTLAGVLTANGGIAVAGGQNLTMSSGVGLFTQTHAPTTDATADASTFTLSAGGTGSTGILRGLVVSQADTAAAGVYDSLAYIQNLKTPETTTNALFIEHNATGGTLSNAINITNTAGTLTTGISMTGTFTNLISASNFSVSNAGSVTIGAAQSYTGTGAVTLSSGGGLGLTLDSALNTLTIDSTDTTLTASGLTTLTVGAGATITNASGNLIFQPAGSGIIANVQIGAGGAGSTTPDFFGLDVKSTTGDPAGGFEGAMYYNTFDNKFRCFQNAAWADCVGAGGGGGVPKESHVIFFAVPTALSF